ncbi:hypothetical protein SAMN04487897_13912 [Paenibacillus sp. yr247]|nr:hypothetical protein SAMN04487897_13912 [Paenibacillus sp. yr247]
MLDSTPSEVGKKLGNENKSIEFAISIIGEGALLDESSLTFILPHVIVSKFRFISPKCC